MEKKICVNNILITTCQIIFGLTFLFSGFVKAVDPMGSTFKFIDYFRVFDLTFLNGSAQFFAVVLAALEFTLGASILFGCYKRIAPIAGVLFMAFFTPFTLYLAIKNPVSDCGCFGDALVITNWQTFWKNVFLLIIIVFLFLNRKKIRSPFLVSTRWFAVFYAFVFSIVISLIGLYYLPIIDFRPFKNGVNIEQDMAIPSNNDKEYVLVYEKNGAKKNFTLENYPANDSTWVFVESKEISKTQKSEPKISNFILSNENGEDITSEILNKAGYTFLLISPDLNEANENAVNKISLLYDYALAHDYNFYGLTVNDQQIIKDWRESTGAEYEFIYSDATILETITRANPGIVLLKDGIILWKKGPNNLPLEDELEAPLNENELGEIVKNHPLKTILLSILLFFTPILLLLLFEKGFVKLVEKIRKK
ncbi:MAG: DoxX family protein [Bacteroidales bacterium]|nr:DoxX family protein [Bacteroidales bacterium]